jgi:hypothetical protein
MAQKAYPFNCLYRQLNVMVELSLRRAALTVFQK